MKSVKTMSHFLFTFLCFILSIIPIIFCIVLIFLCGTFRRLLPIYLMCRHKQKIQLLKGRDALFAISEQKIETIVNIIMIFEGEINLNEIKKALKTSKTTEHPKIRSKIDKCCGYFYWLREPNFVLDRHIRIYDCEPLTNDTEFTAISTDICNRPIPDNISPWEISFVPMSEKYEKYSGKPHFVLILRFHHTLCDGISTALVISDYFVDQNKTKLRNSKFTKISVSELLKTIFDFPNQIMKALLYPDKNILHGPKQTGSRILGSSSYLSLDRVKRVSKLTGTTVNDILTSSVVSALERFYVKIGENFDKPIRAYIPTAMARCGDKIVNNTASYVLELPFNKKCNGVKLLNEIRRLMMEQKTGNFYLSGYYLLHLIVDQLPQWLAKIVIKVNIATFVISNMSWWQNECVLKSGNVLKSCSVYAMHCFDQVIGFAISSYNGKIHITMSADKAVIDNVKDVDWILEKCIEYFEELENLVL